MDFRGRHLPLFVCALLLFYVPTVGAQSTGTVTGTVLDAESGDPLEGVNVSIAILHLVGVSDTEGRFTVSGVPPGPTVRPIYPSTPVWFPATDRASTNPAGTSVPGPVRSH